MHRGSINAAFHKAITADQMRTTLRPCPPGRITASAPYRAHRHMICERTPCLVPRCMASPGLCPYPHSGVVSGCSTHELKPAKPQPARHSLPGHAAWRSACFRRPRGAAMPKPFDRDILPALALDVAELNALQVHRRAAHVVVRHNRACSNQWRRRSSAVLLLPAGYSAAPLPDKWKLPPSHSQLLCSHCALLCCLLTVHSRTGKTYTPWRRSSSCHAIWSDKFTRFGIRVVVLPDVYGFAVWWRRSGSAHGPGVPFPAECCRSSSCPRSRQTAAG